MQGGRGHSFRLHRECAQRDCSAGVNNSATIGSGPGFGFFGRRDGKIVTAEFQSVQGRISHTVELDFGKITLGKPAADDFAACETAHHRFVIRQTEAGAGFCGKVALEILCGDEGGSSGLLRFEDGFELQFSDIGDHLGRTEHHVQLTILGALDRKKRFGVVLQADRLADGTLDFVGKGAVALGCVEVGQRFVLVKHHAECERGGLDKCRSQKQGQDG